ncbi:hypothetical protein GYB57_10060 [bacterium]|nr:hypothetical protein [bacterium]
MKKIALYLFLSIILLSCEKEHMGDCFTSTGSKTSEFRPTGDFQIIVLDDRIDLDLVWDSIPAIKVEAGSGVIDNIITEIKNGQLSIRNENKCNFVRSYKKKVKVTVTGNTFNEITYLGSGEVNCLNTLKPVIFKVDCWESSGDLNLNFESDESYLKIHTGPSVITAIGKSEQSILYLGGVGLIHAENLVAERGFVVNAHTGSIHTRAIEKLEVFLESNGDVYSYGVPNELSVTKTGKGNYIQR